MIVGRATATDPNDPLISLRSSLADDTPEGEVVPISTPDGQRLYAGTARSRLYDGWAANVGLPVAALDGPLAATRFSVAVGGLVAFSLAMALGVMLVRAYARAATTERLEASLKEKETLLREVYHRVKNNLQIVDILVSMQASRLNDPQAKDALADLRRRVHALGLVHQQLMQSKDLATFDVRPFLDELCANLAISSGADERGIRVAVAAEPLRADLDFAVPLGLLVTELVTNALKHGFPDGQAGGVLVSLLTEPSDMVILAVADDGTASERNPVQTSGGVGLRIANALVMQLEGRMDVVQDNGTRVMVTMPRPEAA
jgi:two-component sensor histidine kinase